MAAILKRTGDNTIELTVTIPKADIKKAWDQVVEDTVKDADLAGFRKGKAPKKLVEEQIDKAKVREEILKKLLPKYYIEAVKEHKLNPVLNPKIHVQKLEDDADWEFSATTCEAPEITLKDYKKAIQGVTVKSKIVVPGKEPAQVNLEDIVKALLENVDAKLPKILVEFEADRLLAQTLDDIKRLGLTLDQYLVSTGKSPEALRSEYEQKASSDILFELAIQKVAEDQNITVEEKEISEAVQKAKDEKERDHLEKNRYLLAGILRQQKTLDFLRNL